MLTKHIKFASVVVFGVLSFYSKASIIILGPNNPPN